MDEMKLKPCPFCGASAYLVKEQVGKETQYIIMCTGRRCDCKMGWYLDRDDAIEAWNRRVVQGAVYKVIDDE